MLHSLFDLIFFSVVPSSIAAIAGINKLDADGEELEVEKIFVHPNFSGIDNVHDDIALVKVKNAIDFDDNVKPIRLVEEDLPEGEEVVLSGWGTTTVSRREQIFSVLTFWHF